MGNFKVYLGNSSNKAQYVGQVLADNNVPPSQSGKSGKFLTTNGTTQSWVDIPIDSSTVTKNSSSKLQVSSVLNQNTASGAVATCFDWVGTLAEYNSQSVATNHPDWICYITDDISGGASVYTKTECDNKFMLKTTSVTSIQVYSSASEAQAASQANITKLCLYPAS